MIRLQFSNNLSYRVIGQAADFIFNIHAAPTAHQTVLAESLTISQSLDSILYEDPLLHHRLLRLRANPVSLKISFATIFGDIESSPPVIARKFCRPIPRRGFLTKTPTHSPGRAESPPGGIRQP